jgi:hypothetical protein
MWSDSIIWAYYILYLICIEVNLQQYFNAIQTGFKPKLLYEYLIENNCYSNRVNG